MTEETKINISFILFVTLSVIKENKMEENIWK